jgi:hypothetical protein
MANPCDYFFNGKKLTHDQFRKELKELPMSEIVEMFPSIKDEGISKIGWTTGEQQNERYDLSKTIERVAVIGKNENDDKSKRVTLVPKNGETINMNVSDTGEILTGDYKGNKLEDVIGKELAEKVLNSRDDGKTQFEGNDLKIGGKGMKGFYGSPTEGSLGIVGNVAKSLFKQEPKTTTLQGEKPITIDNTTVERGTKSYVLKNENGDSLATMSFETGDKYSKKDLHDELVYLAKIYAKKEVQETTQYSIDITPELRAQVEKGQPLFMASSENTQAIDDFDKLNKNSINEVNDYIKKYGAKKIKQIRDITSNFGTYITNLEKSNYIIDKKC